MFEYALIELNKVQAPSLLLEDYNYFINKAVNQYINKIYNNYDINQQKTDDIRVLKSTAWLVPEQSDTGLSKRPNSQLFQAVYEVTLPDDYLHILNCIVEYDVKVDYKCYNKNDKAAYGAKRLTADMYSQIINNYYMRPTYKNPYYYINNVNTSNDYPTADNQEGIVFPTNASASLNDPEVIVKENIEKVAENRYGNKNKVKMEIRFGKDDKVFKPSTVFIDYLRAPQFIRLTQTQVDSVIDTSQVLEFPDYASQEIVNELVMLVMENASDPRLQTNIPINQSIANPAQEQQQQQRR